MPTGQPTPDIHASIWTSVRRFEDWLVGLRPGFGTGHDALKCFIQVESRSPYSWIIPGLGFVAVLGLYALLCVWSHTSTGILSMPGALFRIFLFDYMIFFFGLVSGFNMARRWRTNPSQVEELSLVPLPPAVTGGVLAAGTIRTWWRFLILFAIIETIVCIPYISELNKALRIAGIDPLFAIAHPAGLLTLVTLLITPWVLAWFHFESVRLAHWMFAAHALPRVPLLKAGFTNFITMTALVIGLSGLGSAVTGIVFGGLALLMLSVLLSTGNSGFDESFYFGYTMWMLSSVGGALMILWLKRVISRHYEATFVRSWLLYQWWGAGESIQPSEYPINMRRAVPYWELYYRMREEQDANVPLAKRINTRRYYQYMERAGKAVKTTDPGGGFPVKTGKVEAAATPSLPEKDEAEVTSDKN